MIFTCAEDPYQLSLVHQYIKDDKGYIIGSVISTSQGWAWQSCDNAVRDSWSNPDFAPTRQEAINAAIADYIARRME